MFVYELIGCGCESRCCHLNHYQRRDTLNNYNQIIITKDDKNNDMTSNNNNGNGNNTLDVIKNRKMLYWSYVEDVPRIIKTSLEIIMLKAIHVIPRLQKWILSGKRTFWMDTSISVSPHVNIRIPPPHFIETFKINIRVISAETSWPKETFFRYINTRPHTT